MLGLYRGAGRRPQPLQPAQATGKGFVYGFFPTARGDAGAGVRDFAFVYPYTYPAQPLQGRGNMVLGYLKICEGNPSYYVKSVPNAPAQGGGDVSGRFSYDPLAPNFYNAGENTAYF